MKHLLVLMILSTIAAAADKVYVDTTGWIESDVVPIYEDGTSINPDGTLNLANPTERTAYERIPHLKRSCEKRGDESCSDLAKILQNSSFTYLFDPQLSIPYLKLGCVKNNTNSCLLLSASYYNGTGAEKNYPEALRISRKLCTRKIAEGCFNAAINYENGLGIRQDITEAWELFGKACDYGMQEGCEQYSRLNSRYQK